jgi:hypothetical protein
MKKLNRSTRTARRNSIATALRSRSATVLWSVCASVALAHAAEAYVPRPSTVAQHALTRFDPGAPAGLRLEPSSRHEPAMLDKLEGAELANAREGSRPSGVVVVSVRFASAMWNNGLRPDDMIVAVEREPVWSLDSLRRALGNVAWPFVLEITRDGRRVRIFVP